MKCHEKKLHHGRITSNRNGERRRYENTPHLGASRREAAAAWHARAVGASYCSMRANYRLSPMAALISIAARLGERRQNRASPQSSCVIMFYGEPCRRRLSRWRSTILAALGVSSLRDDGIRRKCQSAAIRPSSRRRPAAIRYSARDRNHHRCAPKACAVGEARRAW